MSYIFFPGGYVGVSPIDEERVNVAALVTRKAFLDAGKTVKGVLERASLFNSAYRGRMADGRPIPGSQAAVAPVLTTRSVNAWDLIPHIGDAASVIPPLCGDGMAMALRSVELCGPLADSYLRGAMGLAGWRQEYTRLCAANLQVRCDGGAFFNRCLAVRRHLRFCCIWDALCRVWLFVCCRPRDFRPPNPSGRKGRCLCSLSSR